MKYLIVGLGNIGSEYEDTRHNIGFKVLDAFAKASNAVFEDKRYGAVCELKLKGRTLLLLKPNTYMNLSGKAVSYWMQKEKVALEDLLVIVDDLALPFGTLRLRGQGSDGGHNGFSAPMPMRVCASVSATISSVAGKSTMSLGNGRLTRKLPSQPSKSVAVR